MGNSSEQTFVAALLELTPGPSLHRVNYHPAKVLVSSSGTPPSKQISENVLIG